MRTGALASRTFVPPAALSTTEVGTPITTAAIAPWADQNATRGTARRSITIATWRIHVPGADASAHAAAYRPQPLVSPIAAAANRPSGGQPRSAIASRPVGVVGCRSSGPRKPPASAVVSSQADGSKAVGRGVGVVPRLG